MTDQKPQTDTTGKLTAKTQTTIESAPKLSPEQRRKAELERRKKLSPMARQALEEADTRRQAEPIAAPAQHPKEINGPKGPEPTRYGDWEKKGVTSDF